MRAVILFAILLLPYGVHAALRGQPRIDSLLERLGQTNEDAPRFFLLDDLASTYKTIDPNAGLRYGEEALQIAVDAKKTEHIIRAHITIGLNYMYKSDYQNALRHFNKAQLLSAEKGAAYMHNELVSHLGVLYQEMGNYDKALEYGRKSLENNIRIKDSLSIGGDYGNIGIIYLLKKDFDSALEYDFKSLDIFSRLGDKEGVAKNYGNIGNVYKEYGNYVLALEYDTKALEIFRALGDRGGMAINLGNLGEVYLEMAETFNASERTPLVLPKGTRQMFLASAIENFEKCIAISKEIEQLDNIIEFSEGLSKAYRLSGNYQQALSSYETHVNYKDSVHSDRARLKIAQLETEREQALKEKQIKINYLEKARKKQERLLFALALVILLGLIGYILNKFIQQKRRNKLLAIEKRKHLQHIAQQKAAMGDFAYRHSHDVSGQVATILGLVDIFNVSDYSDPDNKVIIDGVTETAKKLDVIVKDMIVKENEMNK